MTEELTGRVLDAMVAEKVMGWTREPWPEELVPIGVFMYNAPWRGRDGKTIMVARSAEEVPAYSSTWEGLGLVVEEMKRRGWKLRIIEASSCYFCFFVQKANEEQGEGATAPEAVARAALKALGEER